MRLSDEKSRQLTRLVWRERAKIWLPVIAAAVAIIGLVAYFTEVAIDRTDRTVDVQVRSGTVLNVKPGSVARGGAILHVHLSDGRDIDAASGLRVTPPAGTAVLINEARHASGRLTYDVLKVAQ